MYEMLQLITTDFSWLGMLVRACVAALDWNYNVDRQQKVSLTGGLQYRKKVRKARDNQNKLWENLTKYFFYFYYQTS